MHHVIVLPLPLDHAACLGSHVGIWGGGGSAVQPNLIPAFCLCHHCIALVMHLRGRNTTLFGVLETLHLFMAYLFWLRPNLKDRTRLGVGVTCALMLCTGSGMHAIQNQLAAASQGMMLLSWPGTLHAQVGAVLACVKVTCWTQPWQC